MVRIPVSDPVTHNLLQEQNTLLRELLGILRSVVRPQRPYGLKLTPKGETHMAGEDTLTYGVELAPLPSPTDVTKRKLTVTVDGNAQPEVSVAPGEAFPDLVVAEGAAVKLDFVDEDDAGNNSSPLTFEFTAKDEVPPDQPAGLTLTQKGEQAG